MTDASLTDHIPRERLPLKIKDPDNVLDQMKDEEKMKNHSIAKLDTS
jgi:hypothetical protein